MDKQETIMLIKLAQNGDDEALSKLVTENSPLVKCVLKRYKGKNIEYDDLFQLGSIGLLKAIKNFSTDYDVCFSTYAVPMIIGEIKRYLRDDGYIKISRSVKTLSYKINYFIERYKSEHCDSPTVETIAKELGVEVGDVVFAMDSTLYPVSIDEKVDDEHNLVVGDRIADKYSIDDEVEKMTIKDIIKDLSERDKKIIVMRFFYDKTQSEIAKELNVSQVQVSRLENKIINAIKEKMT